MLRKASCVSICVDPVWSSSRSKTKSRFRTSVQSAGLVWRTDVVIRFPDMSHAYASVCYPAHTRLILRFAQRDEHANAVSLQVTHSTFIATIQSVAGPLGMPDITHIRTFHASVARASHHWQDANMCTDPRRVRSTATMRKYKLRTRSVAFAYTST